MKKTDFTSFRSYLLRSFTKTFPNRNYLLMESMIYLMIIAKVKGVYDNLKTNQDWIDYAISIEKEFYNRFGYTLETFKYIKNNDYNTLKNPFEYIKLKKFNFDFNLYLPKKNSLYITKNKYGYCNEEEFDKTEYIADDYLGFTYQFFLSQYEKSIMQSNCSYYTSTETIDSLLKEHFSDANKIYDPFCGTGRIGFADLYKHPILSGSDIDKTAVDLANLNHWLLNLNPNDDFSRFYHEDFYEIKEQHDYIFTNIPFSKSVKTEAEILNKIETMTYNKAVVIIPRGHFERMQQYLNNKNWKFEKPLNKDEFQPFTGAMGEVVSILL